MPRLLPCRILCLLLLGLAHAPALALPSLTVILDGLDAAQALDSDNLTLMATPEALAAVKAGDKAVRAGQPVAAAGHYARARGVVAAGGDAMLDVLARLDSNLVALYIDMRRGETVVSMARTLQAARTGASPASQVEAGRLLARALFSHGQNDAGLEAAKAALALCEAQETWGDDHLETLRCRYLVHLGRFLAAREFGAVNDVLSTVETLQTVLGETSVEYVRLLPAQALADLYLRRVDAAKETLAAAIRGLEAALGDTNPLLEAALSLRAAAAETALGYREATTDRTRVHAIQTAAFGAEHPRALATQLQVARLAFARGLLEEARASAADVASATSPSQAQASLLLAETLLELDRPGAAAAAATEARSRATRPDVRAGAAACLALAQARRGGPFQKPRALARDAVADLAKALGERTIEVARLELRQASVERAAGTYGPALRMIKDVAKLFPETASIQDRLAFLSSRARSRWRRDKAESAEKDLTALMELAAPLAQEAPMALAREKVLAGEVALARGDQDAARERFGLAKASVARLPEGSRAATELLAFQTRVALANEQWDAAITMAERWIAAVHASGGEKDPRLAEANLLLSDAYLGHGDLEQALDAARRVQGMGRVTPDGLPRAKRGAARRVAHLTKTIAAAQQRAKAGADAMQASDAAAAAAEAAGAAGVAAPDPTPPPPSAKAPAPPENPFESVPPAP